MNVSRQIGWSNESNLLYQILKQLNRLTSVLFGLKEAATPKYKVYTALLTQNGADDPLIAYSGDTLTIGVTYIIINNSESYILGDFTNVGAPNNNINTAFVATGTTPNDWGLDIYLLYNSGAPVATVLENTIGNIWFTYSAIGVYFANSDGLFTELKTALSIGNIKDDDGYASVANIGLDSLSINGINIITSPFQSNTDGKLYNTPIEIRVYN
jgi:hypothetical protein